MFIEKYLKKLVWRKDSGMGDALKRLDKLTQQEARMAAAESLRLTQIVLHEVTNVRNGTYGDVNSLPHSERACVG